MLSWHKSSQHSLLLSWSALASRTASGVLGRWRRCANCHSASFLARLGGMWSTRLCLQEVLGCGRGDQHTCSQTGAVFGPPIHSCAHSASYLSFPALLLFVCVWSVCECTHFHVLMWRSEDNFVEFVLVFCFVFFFILFYVYECFPYMHVSVLPHIYLVQMGVRREHWIPWNWSFGCWELTRGCWELTRGPL